MVSALVIPSLICINIYLTIFIVVLIKYFSTFMLENLCARTAVVDKRFSAPQEIEKQVGFSMIKKTSAIEYSLTHH